MKIRVRTKALDAYMVSEGSPFLSLEGVEPGDFVIMDLCGSQLVLKHEEFFERFDPSGNEARAFFSDMISDGPLAEPERAQQP